MWMWTMRKIWAVVLLLSVAAHGRLPASIRASVSSSRREAGKLTPISAASERGLRIRGGAAAKRSISSQMSEAISSVPPVTRAYFLAVLVTAAYTLIGLPEVRSDPAWWIDAWLHMTTHPRFCRRRFQEGLLFEPSRTFTKGQIWR